MVMGLKAVPTFLRKFKTFMGGGKCNLQQKGCITRCVAKLLSMPNDSALSERRGTSSASSRGDLRRTSGEVPGNLVSANMHYFIRRRQRKVKSDLTFANRVIWGPPLLTQEEVFQKHRAEQRKLPAKQPRRRRGNPPSWVVEARDNINKLEDFVITNEKYVADICAVAEFLDNQGALPFVTKKRARMVKAMMELAEANRQSCIAQDYMELTRYRTCRPGEGDPPKGANMCIHYGGDACGGRTFNLNHHVEHDQKSQRLLARAKRYLGKRKLTFRARTRSKA